MLTALMLGARNALCGLRMVPLLGVTGAKRLLAAQWTIDESTAMALAREDHADERAARTAFWATGVSIYVFWNLSTLLGGLGAKAWRSTNAGSRRRDPRSVPRAAVASTQGPRAVGDRRALGDRRHPPHTGAATRPARACCRARGDHRGDAGGRCARAAGIGTDRPGGRRA